MQISLDWLSDYITLNSTPEELAATLTRAGLEVEEILSTATVPEGVVTAKILSREKHPNSDHLSICRVDPGTGAVVFTRRCGSDQMWSADQRRYLRSADLEGLLVTYRGMLDVFYARFFGMLSRASSADLRECRGEIGAVNRRVGFELVRFDPFAEARERLAEA